MSPARSHHVAGMVVAEVPLQHQRGERAGAASPLQQRVHHAVDPYQHSRQLDCRLIVILAALRTSTRPPGDNGLELLGFGLGLTGGLLGFGGYNLLSAHWKSTS